MFKITKILLNSWSNYFNKNHKEYNPATGIISTVALLEFVPIFLLIDVLKIPHHVLKNDHWYKSICEDFTNIRKK